MRPDHEGAEFLRSRLDLDLSAVPCGLSPSAVHRKLSFAVSSSREPCASYRVLTTFDLPLGSTSSLAATHSAQERLPCGSVPHRGLTSGVHSSPGSHSRGFVPSSTFRTSSTVCSATSSAGLFHPAATSRVCPPGV
jgi:hypothetical protein